MLGERRRYVRVSDARRGRLRVYFAPIDGVGVGLYRKSSGDAELLMVFPGLQAGVARAQMHDALLAAKPWPERDPDGAR